MVFSRYTVGSTAATAAVISYAYATREQFYPTVVYLVTSKLCVLALGNQVIVLTLLAGKSAKAVFLGVLREAEVELLHENARYAVTETCLALTVFREELTTRVFALFTALLFAKVFHWLAHARVEHVEHAPQTSTLQHWRLAALMFWLGVVDLVALGGCAAMCLKHGPSVLLLFGFEFAILGAGLGADVCKYGLYALEQRRFDGSWPHKAQYAFFVDFIAEVLRFAAYVVFFSIVFAYYGVPLHIVRELWASYVTLRQRLQAFKKYRALTANMDERFPPASPEEIQEAGGICIICRDDMAEGRKLPCGHVFHFACLRLWLQQQQSCPTCRQDIPVDAQPGAAAAARAAAPEPEPQEPAQEQPEQPGGGWARRPEPAPAAPRLEDALAAALRRLETNLAADEQAAAPPSPAGGARVWTVRAGGAAVRAARDPLAPPLRTVPAGQRVLAMPDDGEYLRVGDGFINQSELEPFLDETATASAAAETGTTLPPSPAAVAAARRARQAPPQPDQGVAAALDALRGQLAEVQRDVAWLRAREEARGLE